MGWVRSLFYPEPPTTRAISPAPEVRALASSAAIPSNSEGFGADAGVWVNDRTALQHMAVLACVRLLADAVSGLPQDVVQPQGAVRMPVPAPRVIREPNPDWPLFDHMWQVMASLALRGNAYERVVERDRQERPSALVPVHPDSVQPIVEDMGGWKRIVKYRIDGHEYHPSDILHTRRMPLPGHVLGLSPIEQARQGIGIGLAAERYGARWFGQSADPSSVLQSDSNMTAEQVQDTQRTWIASHGGRRFPAVLSGGLKYQRISITPDESQFLETKQASRGEIAMMYGIPPHMIGDTDKSTSWGAGIEAQGRGFVTFTLGPWLRCVEFARTRFLLPQGQDLKFNVSALLRGDTLARYTAYTQARNAGWLNVDEIRALEDMPPIPDGSGQSFIQPLNMGPLGSDPLAAKQQEASNGEA